ncbi:MAG: DMT family transporter [Thermodesulfobacteriota bacterium]
MSKIDHNKDNRFPIVGYLFLVATAFFTALSYAFGRALDFGLDLETATFFWFFSSFVLSIFVTLAVPAQRAEVKKLRSYVKIFIYTSVLTSVGAALWIMSIRTIGIPLTSFLMKAQTLFSLFLGMIFLGERLNRGESVGIIITIIGGVIVAYQREWGLLIGTLTALSAAFLYSCISFIVKKVANDLNMLMVANLRALGVSVVMITFLVITGTFEMPSRAIDIVFMALGGISGAYIAKASQFQAIKMIDVSRTTAIMPMESLFVVLLSYFIFDEIPSVIKLLGGGLIIVGVVFLVIFRGQRPDVMDK